MVDKVPKMARVSAKQLKIKGISMEFPKDGEINRIARMGEIQQVIEQKEDELLGKIAEYNKVIGAMKILDIPCKSYTFHTKPPTVNATALYDVLMDPEKLQVLITKLRNKAFW